MAVNRRLASISCIGRAIDAPGVDAVAMWTTLVDRETRSERFASLSTLPGLNSSNGCGAGGARPPTAITATLVRAKAIASGPQMKPLPPTTRTRTEERTVGTVCVDTVKHWWHPYVYKQKTTTQH